MILGVVVVALIALPLVLGHVNSGPSPSYTDGYNMAQSNMQGQVSIESGPAAACDLWASHNMVPTGDTGSQWIQGCEAYMSAHGVFAVPGPNGTTATTIG